MAKRGLSDAEEPTRAVKKVKRQGSPRLDRLSALSDELILRVLSFLSIQELNVCQRLSRKYQLIAGDSQLWKAAYYNRFVRPRASRIPGIKTLETPDSHLYFSSKLSKWLDEENLVRKGKATNWKRQYKLRHNWQRGSCKVSEIQVAEQRPIPPLLVRLHEGVVYTADSVTGLRAWSTAKGEGLLAVWTPPGSYQPTALAVDGSSLAESPRIVIGFRDGSFTVLTFRLAECEFLTEYSHPRSPSEMLEAVACCFPFLITMTATQLLSLYRLDGANGSLELIRSLRSQTAWPPLSLSLRAAGETFVATIAFAIQTILNWTVGLQEMRLGPDGDLLDSRLTTSTPGQHSSLAYSLSMSSPTSRSSSPATFSAAAPAFSPPTSLSYTHPYLLLSHLDNTLTLYMVNSTSEDLSISAGNRLWGHTSSVSGAHVESRGKAVSVSTKGDEVRIWDLEGSFNRRRTIGSHRSVKVSPESRSVMPRETESEDEGFVRGWVGFDNESVVVLKERTVGSQDLVVYSFT